MISFLVFTCFLFPMGVTVALIMSSLVTAFLWRIAAGKRLASLKLAVQSCWIKICILNPMHAIRSRHTYSDSHASNFSSCVCVCGLRSASTCSWLVVHACQRRVRKVCQYSHLRVHNFTISFCCYCVFFVRSLAVRMMPSVVDCERIAVCTFLACF